MTAVDPRTGLLKSKIRQLLWIGFIGGQQVMADGTVIVDAFAIFGVVAAIMTAEASGIVVVTKVVRMRAPCDLHRRKDILAIDSEKCLGGLIDLIPVSIPYLR